MGAGARLDDGGFSPCLHRTRSSRPYAGPLLHPSSHFRRLAYSLLLYAWGRAPERCEGDPTEDTLRVGRPSAHPPNG